MYVYGGSMSMVGQARRHPAVHADTSVWIIIMRIDYAAEVMPHQCLSTFAAPQDLIVVIQRVGREIAQGLDIGNTPAVAALARQCESILVPRIIPDRRYGIGELARFGYAPSTFYRSHSDLIRKDHRKSFVLGRDVLAYTEACLRLRPLADPKGGNTAPKRRRGRPRKHLDTATSYAGDSAGEVTASAATAAPPTAARLATPIVDQS